MARRPKRESDGAGGAGRTERLPGRGVFLAMVQIGLEGVARRAHARCGAGARKLNAGRRVAIGGGSGRRRVVFLHQARRGDCGEGMRMARIGLVIPNTYRRFEAMRAGEGPRQPVEDAHLRGRREAWKDSS